MLNEEKIILMTKLAIYEKGEGKKEIPMSRYYRNDYVGVHMLYTFLCVTAGYVLLFALYIARDVEEFLSSLTTMDLKKFLFTALAIYIVAELFFLFVTWFLYRRRFKKNRQHLNEYYGDLKKLRKLQKKEQAAAMKMVEGKEAEGESVLNEEPSEDDMDSEDTEEDDIFREPEEKGHFRRQKAGRAGKASDKYDREDGDPYGNEDRSSFPQTGDGAKKSRNQRTGKNSDFTGRDFDEDEDDDVKLYTGKQTDAEKKSKEAKKSQEMEKTDINLTQKDSPEPEQNTDPNPERNTDSNPERNMDPESERNTDSNPEQNTDPDLAVEQALKKLLQDASEDDEEDEDGFTFSS